MQFKLNSNCKFQISNFRRGFTLIEIMVVIAIIVILSAIILFSITLYINKGKDANVKGNLAILVPAGEVWYNVGNTYNDFCGSDVVANARNEIPKPQTPVCGTGICCLENEAGDEWAACAELFAAPNSAYCVDSRGVKKEIPNADCTGSITQCP